MEAMFNIYIYMCIYKFTFCMHDCKNIDTFIPGKMVKFLEKSGNFVSEKSGNPGMVIAMF